ncbi:tripartite tricarboxylate transporter substrate binding protein [Polaromonas sp. SM01]|uniref:Bug family tripartite tricarboxylate transporter substrate binding protein n=1 Tax=Polaromonas sp. SM01 TaxID=3085630 RepID=UPI0029817FA4|nr:tripartite tricarboxylate transporter substrate binding protein [Polaromonas sp. SM01]MDW5443126.1 tripartite tricarboxylate transporter substrate binding protein [Polaromonas sp. SM01]
MTPSSLRPLQWAAVAAAAMTLMSPAGAQEAYPSRVVELITPYAAGGGVSAIARVYAAEASKVTNQQWVVLNKEGAGGVVGFTAMARAKPDGYTVGFAPASPMTNSPFVNAKMPFTNDQIEPVCQVFENVFAVAVKDSSPIKSLPELIALAKSKPGAISYGHAGPASVPHLSIAAIEKSSGIKFNGIPYRGDGPVLTDVMGGSIDFAVPAISSLAGKNLRVLAVLSEKKHPAMPDAPIITQFGYPAISPGLNGVYAPAGTPKPVLAELEAICKKVVASPSFAQGISGLLQTPQYLSAKQFKARIQTTYKVHAELVPGLNIEKN